MGTYTANKNLYMPSVGETGWGTLMNGNLETIDNFLKPITVSGSTYTFTGSHVGNQSGGSVSATSITNSGTLTNTGKITANGGIGTKALTATTGTFSGAVTGASFNGVPIKNSGTITVTAGSTIMGYLPIFGEDVGDKHTLLPSVGTVKYTGSIKFKGTYKSTPGRIVYCDGLTSGSNSLTCTSTDAVTLSFTNIPYLMVYQYYQDVQYYNFTLS